MTPNVCNLTTYEDLNILFVFIIFKIFSVFYFVNKLIE